MHCLLVRDRDKRRDRDEEFSDSEDEGEGGRRNISNSREMNGTSDSHSRKHRPQADTSQESQPLKSSEETQKTEARLKPIIETTEGKGPC